MQYLIMLYFILYKETKINAVSRHHGQIKRKVHVNIVSESALVVLTIARGHPSVRNHQVTLKKTICYSQTGEGL